MPGLDQTLRALAAETADAAAEDYAALRFHKALARILALSSAGNLRMQQAEPWVGIKSDDPAEARAAREVLVECLETIRICAVLLLPVTPALGRRILLQLGLSEEAADAVTWADAAWGGLRAGAAFPKPKPVFARLDGDFVTEAAGEAAAAAP